jgi:hypothetical protein
MQNWSDYFANVKTLLGAREAGFEAIFKYLDGRPDPLIVETGTYREENNYTGDGCSTLLFDHYINSNNGYLISVDIDPEACKLARDNTSDKTEVIKSDSVEFLGTLAGQIDLLYLDSYNITNWLDDWAPAAHHLKELFAVKDAIKPGTLIVVDDNITTPDGRRLGKGRLIYELMDSLGIEPFIDNYQVAWIWSEV